MLKYLRQLAGDTVLIIPCEQGQRQQWISAGSAGIFFVITLSSVISVFFALDHVYAGKRRSRLRPIHVLVRFVHSAACGLKAFRLCAECWLLLLVFAASLSCCSSYRLQNFRRTLCCVLKVLKLARIIFVLALCGPVNL